MTAALFPVTCAGCGTAHPEDMFEEGTRAPRWLCDSCGIVLPRPYRLGQSCPLNGGVHRRNPADFEQHEPDEYEDEDEEHTGYRCESCGSTEFTLYVSFSGSYYVDTSVSESDTVYFSGEPEIDYGSEDYCDRPECLRCGELVPHNMWILG